MLTKHSCEHCNGRIEFDSDELIESTHADVPCPHCGLEIILALPQQNLPIVPSAQLSAKSEKPFRAEDFPEGMKWLRKGAALGDVESMASLGVAFLFGLGFVKDYTEAVNWLRRAAEQGDATARNNLGFCYYHGYGVSQNFTEAEKWFRKAAEQGDPGAQYHLGCLYQLGQGLLKDPREAFAWWLKAAEQGNIIAQNNVGIIYDLGEIVKQNYVEAYKWMNLAAGHGHEDAKQPCNELASKMSAEEREESVRRIELFTSENKEHKSEDNGVIGRLAERGDVEAQAILNYNRLLKEDPEEAERFFLSSQLNKTGVDYLRRQIPSEVRREVWRRDEGKCRKCGSRINLEYDHIVPISKGGSNTIRNIELLCESCNRMKSAFIQ